MTFILNLETSTTVCSVSITGDGELICFREVYDAKSHASQLIPFIKEVLESSGINSKDLSAIAVSKGPGSYTGLRIGVSTAKGLAYSLNIPLISICTLYSMSSGFLDLHPDCHDDPNALLCPMIDARRMEVYSALYSTRYSLIRNIEAEIIDASSFMTWLKENHIHFFGNGAMKCKDLISNKNATFYEGFHPSSAFMGKITFQYFLEKKFENLAYFEPFYLKDFVATIPINKLF